jgi:hypothetical protein
MLLLAYKRKIREILSFTRTFIPGSNTVNKYITRTDAPEPQQAVTQSLEWDDFPQREENRPNCDLKSQYGYSAQIQSKANCFNR